MFLAGNGFDVDLYVAAADARIQQRLTHEPAFRASPSWSPDGAHLAYASREGLMLMRADGTDEVNLSPELGQPSSITWSPDGSQILFESHSELYLVDTDEGNPQRLPDPGPGRGIQDWQPIP